MPMIDQPVAVVTGASRGIGNAIAAALAADGYAVVAAGSSAQEAVAANLEQIARHARPGTYVGVRGRFRRGGWIEAEAVHVGRWRRMKMAVSIAAAAAVAVMLRRRFRWDREQRGFASR